MVKSVLFGVFLYLIYYSSRRANIRKEYVTVETHHITQVIQGGWSPRLLRTSSKQFHFSISYAFLMSVLTAMEQFVCFL